MIELGTFKKILEENEERFPLLTLDEFFNGNTEEDSIAPNQWNLGDRLFLKYGICYKRLS